MHTKTTENITSPLTRMVIMYFLESLGSFILFVNQCFVINFSRVAYKRSAWTGVIKNRLILTWMLPVLVTSRKMELAFCRQCSFCSCENTSWIFFSENTAWMIFLHNIIIPVKYSRPCKPTDQIPSPIPTDRLDSAVQCDNILNHGPRQNRQLQCIGIENSTTGNAMKITV